MQVINPEEIDKESAQNIKRIDYTIGDMIIESEFGVKVKSFMGVRETVKIPVKFEYTFVNENEN